jgi:hypothetical protein
MNLVRIGIILFIQMSFLLIYPIYEGFAEGQDIIIKTLPEKEFLTLKNMAPGRSVTKTITVQNNGKNDFNYTTYFKLKSGSEKLFNELQLSVLKEDKILFDGSMKDFKGLDPRQLKGDTEDELTFKVSVPTQLGNDFQGLSSEVEITFNAQSILDGVTGGETFLPDTGTNIFNFLVTGTVLLLSGWILQLYFLKRKRLNN